MKHNFAIIALAGMATAKQLRPSNGLTSQQIGEYNEYIGKLGKNPVNTKDYEKKVGIFWENKIYVDEVNAAATGKGPDALTLEMNAFADYTEEEMEKHMGLMPEFETENSTFESSLGAGLSSRHVGTFDHVRDGHMTKVKNQGACGSCWAFAANSTLEGTLAAKTGKRPRCVSEQQLVDCTRKDRTDKNGQSYGMSGCKGGYYRDAWRYQKNNGFMPCRSYKYISDKTKTEQQCRYSENKVIGKVTGWGYLNSVEAMLDTTRKQPIAIALYASAKAFAFYKSGVIQRSQCNHQRVNHAVTIVGYNLSSSGLGDADDETSLDVGKNPVNFWKVQNSWGSWWGDNGFVRLNIDKNGIGVCGMNQHALSVEATFI